LLFIDARGPFPISGSTTHGHRLSDTRSPFNSLLDIECALTITAVVSRCIDFDFIHPSPTAFFWGFSYSFFLDAITRQNNRWLLLDKQVNVLPI
jgi:hypothetical protein